MPSSLASRNFVISAIPFIEVPPTGAEPYYFRFPQIAPLLVFSSSFLNGSFCPELINIEGSHSPKTLLKLFPFCAQHSSTLQFITSIAGLVTRTRAHQAFEKLVYESRYFVRQLRHLELNTNSICLSSAYLSRFSGLRTLKLSNRAEIEDSNIRAVTAANNSQLTFPMHRIPHGYEPDDVELSKPIHLLNILVSLPNLEELNLLVERPIPSRHSQVFSFVLLRKAWELQPMRHLTSLELNFTINDGDENEKIDLSVIVDAHPQLKKLHFAVSVPLFNNHRVIPDITPPNLARLTELEDIELCIPALNRAVLQQLVEEENDTEFDNGIRLSKTGCALLSRIAIIEKNVSFQDDHLMDEIIEHFFEKIDGSLVTSLKLPFNLWCTDRRTEFLSKKFPLLGDLYLQRQCTNESLKMIGQNMEAGSLVNGLTINFSGANDDGISHLFDPKKAVRGCYETLTSLRISSASRNLTGKGWFGDILEKNEAFTQKQFVVRSLHFPSEVTLSSEGFSEILVAFSHCLEVLTMPLSFRGDDGDNQLFVPSDNLLQCKLPKLIRLINFGSKTRRASVDHSAVSLGVILPLCPSLQSMAFGHPEEIHIAEFVRNVVESESKTIEISAFSLPRVRRHTCDALSKLNSLRCLKTWEWREDLWGSAGSDEDEEENCDADEKKRTESTVSAQNLFEELMETREDVRFEFP